MSDKEFWTRLSLGRLFGMLEAHTERMRMAAGHGQGSARRAQDIAVQAGY